MWKKVRIWDYRRGGAGCVELEVQKAGRVAFSPEGRYLACCSVDNNICIWNVAGWTTSCVFKSGIELRSITFSPDSRHIALSAFRRGYIWDIAAQQITCVLEEETTSVDGKAIVFSPDGHFISSVDVSSAHLWKVSTKDLTFEHPYTVKATTFSPKGHLASCSDDGMITVWNLETRVAFSVFEGKGRWAGSFQMEFSLMVAISPYAPMEVSAYGTLGMGQSSSKDYGRVQRLFPGILTRWTLSSNCVSRDK